MTSTPMTSEATPRPWILLDGGDIGHGSLSTIAVMADCYGNHVVGSALATIVTPDERRANAALILQCVNERDALIAERDRLKAEREELMALVKRANHLLVVSELSTENQRETAENGAFSAYAIHRSDLLNDVDTLLAKIRNDGGT